MDPVVSAIDNQFINQAHSVTKVQSPEPENSISADFRDKICTLSGDWRREGCIYCPRGIARQEPVSNEFQENCKHEAPSSLRF